jgi:mannose-1-phosphate guanylyltransferase
MKISGDGRKDHAAIVLAGGEGTRLKSLTRKISGCEIPKQFCQVIGSATPLEQTLFRASLLADPSRVLTVLTRAHERFYSPILAGAPQRNLVVQPDNRGTAPAILYGLLRLAQIAPSASVAIFPSDHYVGDDLKFIHQVELALEAATVRPEITILLGLAADSPEVGYGWIEPGEPIAGGAPTLFKVSRFWEKPMPEVASVLLERGCLWNSFVMVARVSTLLGLIMMALPQLYAPFAAIRSKLGTPFEDRAVSTLYADLPPLNFSDQVLASQAVNLAVLPVRGLDWSDLGEPHRVMEVLARTGTTPRWAAA